MATSDNYPDRCNHPDTSHCLDYRRIQARLDWLQWLDGKRKGSVLQFLRESNLIDKDKRIVDLTGADLSYVSLANDDRGTTHLGGIGVLHWTTLLEIKGNMNKADLSGANLRKAD